MSTFMHYRCVQNLYLKPQIQRKIAQISINRQGRMSEVYITCPYRKFMRQRLGRIHNRQAAYATYPYQLLVSLRCLKYLTYVFSSTLRIIPSIQPKHSASTAMYWERDEEGDLCGKNLPRSFLARGRSMNDL